MRCLLTLAALLSLTACFGEAELKQSASGFVGCSPDDVEISNDVQGLVQRSFDATCRGHLYHCSGLGCTEDSAYTDPNAEVVRAPTAPPAAQRPEATTTRKHLWSRYVAKDCGVSVLLPGTPKEVRTTAKGRGVSAPVFAAEVESQEGAVAVSCSRVPGTAPVRVGSALDGGRDHLLEDLGATLESEQDIDLGDAPGRDLRFTASGQRARARVILQDRQIVVLRLMPVSSYSRAEIVDYFSSLEPAPADRQVAVAR